MTLLRALAMPFQFTSLLLMGSIAVAAALCMALATLVGPLVALPLIFLLSWLNKYANALLDHAANGVIAAPVASAEMLGPFGGARPLVHVVLGSGVAALVYFEHSRWSACLGLVALLLFPASAGALAMHQRALDAISPPALWRTLRGLGHYYLLLLVGLTVCVLGIYLLARAPLWPPVSYLLIALLWLCLYALIGGTLFLRREALRFEPCLSPEWFAERNALEHERRRQRVVDTVYASIRVRDAPRASVALLAWVAATDPGQHMSDAQAIVTQAAHWPEQRGLRTVARTLVVQFIKTQQLAAALATAEAALARVGDFALDTAADTDALARYAQQCGRTRVAQNLRDNYARASTPLPLQPGQQGQRVPPDSSAER